MAVRIALRYLDRYVKREGRWMFQVRRLKFRCALPFDEVANGLDDPMRVRPPHAIACVRSCKVIDGLRPSPSSGAQPGRANRVRCAFVLRRSTSNKQARLQDGNEGQNETARSPA